MSTPSTRLGLPIPEGRDNHNLENFQNLIKDIDAKVAKKTDVDVLGSEIDVARGGSTTLGERLNGVSAQLANHSHSWGQVTGKPSTFTPSAHTHTIADVTGLQSAINEKASKEVATTQVPGLMSSSDKTKLNGLSSDATTLQGRIPSNFVEVVNHGTLDNYVRPVGGISVLWIGTVEPQNAIDNDIWIGGV